jgi:uncharacterized protein with PQ loop repeat
METVHVIGYVASSASVIAFSSQLHHTVKTQTTAGLSLKRTVFDIVSLALWIYYATRVEDIPLLIATAVEFFASLCLCVVIVKERHWKGNRIKDFTPPPSPPAELKSILVERLDRRNSV